MFSDNLEGWDGVRGRREVQEGGDAVTICSDFEPPKIKSDTVSTVSPSISH